MSDLRQGVAPAGHAVLHYLEAQQDGWGDIHDTPSQMELAHNQATIALHAYHAEDYARARDLAIDAAARLIDAIGEMDREIAGDVVHG
ncbi:MAG TPA: hypothetical protein VF475_14685 [Sphingobium sp.]